MRNSEPRRVAGRYARRGELYPRGAVQRRSVPQANPGATPFQLPCRLIVPNPPEVLFAADPLVAKTGYSVHVMQVDYLTDKEQWEQRVFAAFAKRSGLKINECSIKSCKPPMPDICCSLDGSDYFFELAEVVPQVQAQALNTKGVYTSAFPDPDELGPRAMVNI